MDVEFLYLDESGDPGWPKGFGGNSGRYFIYAGVILDSKKNHVLKDDLTKLMRDHFSDASQIPEEVHYADAVHGNGRYGQLTTSELSDFRDGLFDLILDIEPTIMASVVDKKRMKQKYGDFANNPKRYAFRATIARFHKHLVEMDTVGNITIDSANRSYDRELRRVIYAAQESGIRLPGSRAPEDTTLPRIIDTITMSPSEMSAGIQLADIVAYQIFNHFEFGRLAEVAIDMTYIAYYGDRDELEMVMGAPRTKAYEWCYKFATLTVVGENVKFTLAMRPVKKGDKIGEIVRELFWQAREHVSISMVYADSEFCSADTIHALEEAGVNYVIPSPKNTRVKREIDRMQQGIEVKKGYTIYGPVLGGGVREPAETNLVLLPSSKDESKTVAFITNKDVNDEIGLDRVETKGLIDRYSRRWGIENSYKTIKDFLAWTTSKDFSVRVFYFGFAVLLYNMWLLVDLLVQVSLDVEHRYKPRVTAKRFLNLVRKRLAGIG